jgi:hypothetical protein
MKALRRAATYLVVLMACVACGSGGRPATSDNTSSSPPTALDAFGCAVAGDPNNAADQQSNQDCFFPRYIQYICGIKPTSSNYVVLATGPARNYYLDQGLIATQVVLNDGTGGLRQVVKCVDGTTVRYQLPVSAAEWAQLIAPGGTIPQSLTNAVRQWRPGLLTAPASPPSTPMAPNTTNPLDGPPTNGSDAQGCPSAATLTQSAQAAQVSMTVIAVSSINCEQGWTVADVTLQDRGGQSMAYDTSEIFHLIDNQWRYQSTSTICANQNQLPLRLQFACNVG